MSDFGKDKNRKPKEIINKTNLSNQTSNTITQKLHLKTVFYMTITVILFLATLTGCLFGILSNKETEATKIANIAEDKYIGGKGADLFNSPTDINLAVFKDLLAKMGGGLGYTTVLKSQQYVIQINNRLYDVVYRSKDYITIWLADNFQEPIGTLFTTPFDSSGTFHNYAAIDSTVAIRSALNGTVYNGLFGNIDQTIMNSIIATPRNLHDAGIRWQSGQGTDGSTTGEISWAYDDINNNRTTYSGLGSGGAGTAAYDKLWLPSGPELFAGCYRNSQGHYWDDYPGIWGVVENQILYDTGDYSWLRSGWSSRQYPNRACQISKGGWNHQSSDLVDRADRDYGVRPALHLNLSNLATLAGYYLKFKGAGIIVNPSAENTIRTVQSKTIVIKPISGCNVIYSIVDQWGNSLTINGSGSTGKYNYSTSFNNSNGEFSITFNNVTNDVEFTVTLTQTLSIINNNSATIMNISGDRFYTSAPTALIRAEYKNGTFPRVTVSNGLIDLSSASGSGRLGSVSYEFAFVNSIMTLNLSGLPNGVYTITLDTIPIVNYKITTTANNAKFAITYNDMGNAEIIIQPNSGYWVNNFVVDGKTFFVEYKDYIISDVENADKIFYLASEVNNKFFIMFKTLKNNISLTVNCSTVPLTDLKECGGTQINGVAVNTTLGGDAKIIANDLNNSDGGTITIVAWVNAGYTFAGWSTDGGATYLTDSSGTKYGASATIPANLVKGKVITACFILNANNNINTDTSSGGSL